MYRVKVEDYQSTFFKDNTIAEISGSERAAIEMYKSRCEQTLIPGHKTFKKKVSLWKDEVKIREFLGSSIATQAVISFDPI